MRVLGRLRLIFHFVYIWFLAAVLEIDQNSDSFTNSIDAAVGLYSKSSPYRFLESQAECEHSRQDLSGIILRLLFALYAVNIACTKNVTCNEAFKWMWTPNPATLYLKTQCYMGMNLESFWPNLNQLLKQACLIRQPGTWAVLLRLNTSV